MKNWKHYFFEFLLLFAAISLGFWVENYREERREKQLLKKQLQSFLAEYEVAENSTPVMTKTVVDICASISRGDKLPIDTLEFLMLQWFVMRSGELDDIYDFAEMTKADYYQYIRNDRITGLFFLLNDLDKDNEDLMIQSRELGKEFSTICSRYNILPDLWNAVVRFRPDVVPVSGYGEGGPEYKNMGDLDGFYNDPDLKLCVRRMYHLHMTSQAHFVDALAIIESGKEMIQKEIDGL
jgi:hypothetical protein